MGYSTEGLHYLTGNKHFNPELPFSRQEFITVKPKKQQGMSISGFQPKLQLIIEEDHFDSVNQQGNYILKPSPEEYPFLAENEHATMRVMKELGFDVPENGLVSFAGEENQKEFAFVIKRFDRDEQQKAIHQEQLDGAMNIRDKYGKIGADNEQALKKMKELYSPFYMQNERMITMDIRSAEMTKYAANTMLATKISFMNEIANICERVGADVNKVRIGIGSDSRIGYSFIYPGCGYGGSCFPKDVLALKKLAEEVNYKAELIESVDNVNNRQKYVIAQKVIKKYGEDLTGKTFAVWGLSFKPETDDMREAPAIYIIKELVKRGATVRAYDPKAVHEAKVCYLKDVPVTYVDSKYEALKDADALLLLTEWKEFRMPDFVEIAKLLKEKVIFDGRNQYNAFDLPSKGFEYIQIGV